MGLFGLLFVFVMFAIIAAVVFAILIGGLAIVGGLFGGAAALSVGAMKSASSPKRRWRVLAVAGLISILGAAAGALLFGGLVLTWLGSLHLGIAGG